MRSIEVWHANYGSGDREVVNIKYDYVQSMRTVEFGRDNPHLVIDQEGPDGVRETTSIPAHYVYKIVDRTDPEQPVSKHVAVD